MINFIYNIPTFLLLALLFVLFLFLSFTTVVLVHRFVPLEVRTKSNGLIEFLNTSIGPVYAILVGFTILSEIQNYNDVTMIEHQEATKAASIYRASALLPNPIKQEIQNSLKTYIAVVLYKEWPSYAPGRQPTRESEAVLINLLSKIASYKVSDPMQQSFLKDITTSIDELFDYNDDRVAHVGVALNPDIWFVIILATLLFLGVQCFYGAEFYMHLSAVFVMSLITASVTYLIVALDHPFVGYYSVKPTTFKNALIFMDKKNQGALQSQKISLPGKNVTLPGNPLSPSR